jgi:sugar O-acyltransferase (sialic acid O-acetyltransferase NeuD family)
MQREREIYEKICSLNIPDDRLFSPIDPSAVVAYDYSELASGIMVGPLAQIGPDVIIGKNTVILGNSFVGHDTKIGEFCHIATNATVGALIEIGNACHIGMTATIREKTKIGNYCLVGMGAVVLNDIDDNSIVVGNPAKLLRVKEKI